MRWMHATAGRNAQSAVPGNSFTGPVRQRQTGSRTGRFPGPAILAGARSQTYPATSLLAWGPSNQSQHKWFLCSGETARKPCLHALERQCCLPNDGDGADRRVTPGAEVVKRDGWPIY